MNYLVTGGAGFIGSHLVDRLIDEGHKVFCLDNFVTGKLENLNSKAEFIFYKVEDLVADGGWGATNFDAIFHCAALARIQPSFDYPVKTHEANVNGTLAVLEFARQKKIKVIYAGTSSMYHCPYANPYTFTKGVGEQYCTLYNKVFDVPVAIGRFFNVYGPRQLEEGAYATVIGIFEKQWREGRPLTITGDGEKRRDFTHVSDIVSGLVAMSKDEWNCDIFNLGTGRNHSINELAALFKHETTYIPERPGEAQTTLADISFTQEKLGWAPQVSLEDYIDGVLHSQHQHSGSDD